MKLSDKQKRQGVVTASLGNHSQALSYHAKIQGIPATVVMPSAAPLVKVEACKRFGATAIIYGETMSEAKEYAHQYCKEHDLTYINGYDDPYIIAGQGTIALEIFEDMPDIEGIVVPIGGGGLIAGIALAAKTLNKNIKIIGVESDRCPSFSSALKAGKPVKVENKNSIADGLAVAEVGANAFNIAAPLIDKMIVVKEEWISLTILRLIELEKCVVEGAGAAGLAAILCGGLKEFEGKKLAVVLCGGNIDSNILGRCIERSLAADGRLLKFSVSISDRPGGVSDICGLLAKIGVSIKDIVHERAWLTSEVFQVKVIITCETRDEHHVKEVKETLVKHYTNVAFDDLPMLRL
ncbi:L-threonine ammonia-lyase isoform X2 [Planococcus citri]